MQRFHPFILINSIYSKLKHSKVLRNRTLDAFILTILQFYLYNNNTKLGCYYQKRGIAKTVVSLNISKFKKQNIIFNN